MQIETDFVGTTARYNTLSAGDLFALPAGSAVFVKALAYDANLNIIAYQYVNLGNGAVSTVAGGADNALDVVPLNGKLVVSEP